MAIGGAKPKPAYLKLLTAKSGHKATISDPADQVDSAYDNGLEPPVPLGGRQLELWLAFIRPAPWLTKFDTARAFMWVHLHAEFEAAPSGMIAGMISQLRSLGSELGLDPASRMRLPVANDKNKNPAEKYFT